MRRVLLGACAVVALVVLAACSQAPQADSARTVVETVTVAAETQETVEAPAEEEPPAEEPAPSEEVAEEPDDAAAELAAAENLWRVNIADWGDQIASTFGELGEMFQDQGQVALILLGDQEATIRIAAQLSVLMSCGRTLRQEVGPPPTQRMRKSYRLMRRACGKFNLTAQRIATGLDNRDGTTFQDAMVSMDAGRMLVLRATEAIPVG